MSDPQAHPYATYLDVLFPQQSVVDVPSLVATCTDRWYNQTLCKVNDSVVRLGVMQGEYHWHKHDNDDEFFFVLDGHFIIDLEGRSIDLRPRQGYVVPKGVVHHIAVSPRCQGEGMGRQLMLFAEGEAKRQGYREIRLYTNERFTENIAIYARLGYRETRREQVPLGIVVHMAKPV